MPLNQQVIDRFMHSLLDDFNSEEVRQLLESFPATDRRELCSWHTQTDLPLIITVVISGIKKMRDHQIPLSQLTTIIDLLADTGIDIDQTSRNGRTALTKAFNEIVQEDSYEPYLPLFAKLLERGANPEIAYRDSDLLTVIFKHTPFSKHAGLIQLISQSIVSRVPDRIALEGKFIAIVRTYAELIARITEANISSKQKIHVITGLKKEIERTTRISLFSPVENFSLPSAEMIDFNLLVANMFRDVENMDGYFATIEGFLRSDTYYTLMARGIKDDELSYSACLYHSHYLSQIVFSFSTLGKVSLYKQISLLNEFDVQQLADIQTSLEQQLIPISRTSKCVIA